MQTFRASDGVTLAYTIDDFTDPWKPPETLVMLHAAMGSHRRFYAWVPHLCRDFRVVRVDLRGHGASEIPGPDGLTLPRLVQDVVDLADHLGLDRFHLAGSSAGAIIALATAIEHGPRLLTLGSFATTPGLKPSNVPAATWVAEIQAKGVREFLAGRIKDRFDLNQVEPGFVEWFLDESAETSPALLARFVPLMASVDLTDDLHRIPCPTLCVVPDHDPISSMAQYERLRDRIPNCEFVVYAGLPHNITDAAPDRCARDLRSFLLRHRGGA